jgi:YbbR domain-containing protein
MKLIKEHGLKIFTLILAIFLWFWVSLNSNVEVQKSFIVQLKPLAGTALSYQSHENIAVTLVGPKNELIKFYEQKPFIKVNVKKEYNANPQVLFLNPTHFQLPFGIRIQKIEPQEIQYSIDQEMIKNLPIHVIKKGEVPLDHTIISETYSPKMVQVTGAASILKEIDKIDTEEVWLNELVGLGTKNIQLIKPHQSLSLSPDKIQASMKIRPERANLVLKKIPITFVSQKLIKKVEKKLVNVLVLKDKKYSSQVVSPEDVKVFAKVLPSERKLLEVELTAELPPGLYLKEIQPQKIKVWLAE